MSDHPSRTYRPTSLPYSATVQSSKLRHHPMLRDFKHVNTSELHDESLTLGQRIADKVAATMGSLNFIIIQSIILFIWIIINTIDIPLIHKWDNYPYILLNLALSFQAAYTGPFVLISQNRQAEKDRLKADQDYKVNLKAEAEVNLTLEKIEHQNEIIERQNTLILDLVEKLSMQEEREQKMLEDQCFDN